ncbi:hypothetical protein GCM10022207_79710 [Streptomyces lannensis]|uniref:Uncharacterized protein n=1 Tax=Streptomyces lannensis TaxID=766498 RepID=A0ABP7LF54_9ACTN
MTSSRSDEHAWPVTEMLETGVQEMERRLQDPAEEHPPLVLPPPPPRAAGTVLLAQTDIEQPRPPRGG